MNGRDTARGFARRLGLPSAAALVVASMVGAGVFTTSGLLLADLGRPEPVLLAWLAGGVVALCGAVSYGALARRIPWSGGEYVLLSETFHPLAGFLAGWISLLAGFTAPIAVAALGLQVYLAEVVNSQVRPEWMGTASILAAGAMHGLRFRLGVIMQNAAVAVKLLLIGGFLLLGVVHLSGRTQPLVTGVLRVPPSAFAVALLWISYAYSGWNAASYVAGEVVNPGRNIQRAFWLPTAVVTAIYLCLNAVFLYSAPTAELAGKVQIGAVAAEALGGSGLRRAVSLLVALALFTSISSMVMAGPRVYARMARDGILPSFLAAGQDTPAAAVALQVGLAVVVVWVSGLVQLLSYIGFMLGLSSAATVAGLIRLRRREGPERVPVTGYPWIPVFFIMATLITAGCTAISQPVQAGIGVLTLGAGLPIYALMRWRSGPVVKRARPGLDRAAR